MRPFRQVDVFSPEPLRGNPVAVVHGAEGLSTEQMERFTRWTNLSEATFLLPPTDPAADYAVRRFQTMNQPLGELFEYKEKILLEEMTRAPLLRAALSKRQLYEVMVEFWSNHFSIQLINGFEPVLKPEDDARVIRPHALGNFRDLLFASAKSGAMIYYLDNFLNTAEAPNENYARELLELHTMGVDGGYSEQDIQEAVLP